MSQGPYKIEISHGADGDTFTVTGPAFAPRPFHGPLACALATALHADLCAAFHAGVASVKPDSHTVADGTVGMRRGE